MIAKIVLLAYVAFFSWGVKASSDSEEFIPGNEKIFNTSEIFQLRTSGVEQNKIDERRSDHNFFDPAKVGTKLLTEMNDLESKKKLSKEDKYKYLLNIGNLFLTDGETEKSIDIFKQAVSLAEKSKSKSEDEKKKLKEAKFSLALAYFRLGEQDNCIHNHNAKSCLFPIKGRGIHYHRKGSTEAITILSDLLNKSDFKHDPKAQLNILKYQWLFNLAYMTLGKYPDEVPKKWVFSPQLFESEYDIKQFPDRANLLGVDVTDLAGGSITEDFNGDGYLDILTSGWSYRGRLVYFINNGDGSFSDKTKDAQLEGILGGLNMVSTDYNNDGHKDFYIFRGVWQTKTGNIADSLMRNNGDGTFTDVSASAGTLSFHPSGSGCWGDYDNDGWLDFFVVNESFNESTGGQKKGKNQSKQFQKKAKKKIIHPTEFFHNNGDGTFTEISKELGLDLIGYGKGCTWGDIDNDGLIDLYVTFLYEPNVLLKNLGKNAEGKWRFSDITKTAKVADPLHSFTTWFWDYNNDGWLDLFAAGFSSTVEMTISEIVGQKVDPQYKKEYGFRLYRNNKDSTFTDVTDESFTQNVFSVMGANFGDLDNDGFLDFYLGTGAPDFGFLVPNRMFRNAEGKSFQDVTTSGGFGHLQKGHGISYADLDNDGDQDIYAVFGGALKGDTFRRALFENPGHDNHWITLDLEGTTANRAAIGARIKITVLTKEGKEREIHALVSSGGSFGASSLQQEIGLGQAESLVSVEINWPSQSDKPSEPGKKEVQVFRDLKMDQIYKIIEGNQQAEVKKLKRFTFGDSNVTGL